MRRRDFVKAIVAVPVTAVPLFSETAAPSPEEASAASPAAATPASAPTSAPPTPPPAASPKRVEQMGHFAFRSPVPNIPATVPDAFAITEQHFFDADEMATLRKLSDVLLPPLNGYPGATQTGAAEFLDFLISVSPADQQHMYRSGLNRLNREAENQFHIPFARVNAQQADVLLRPWLRAWINDHPPTEPYARFINIAHHEIRTAAMNSQAWSIAATSAGERAPGIGLYWSPIDPDIQMYV